MSIVKKCIFMMLVGSFFAARVACCAREFNENNAGIMESAVLESEVPSEVLDDALPHALNTELFKVIRKGKERRVRALLAHKAQVNGKNREGRTPLMMACQHGFIDMARLLLKAQADVEIQNNTGSTALILAAYNSQGHIIDQLLAAHADVNVQNRYGETALTYAARSGCINEVEALLKAKAYVDNQNEYGFTALVRAAYEGCQVVAERLLAAGASVNRVDRWSCSALMLAARRGHGKVVDLLLEYKAFIDMQNKVGYTALMEAVSNDHEAVVSALLDAQAQVDIGDKQYRKTALMLAIERNKLDLARALLRENRVREQINIQDKEGCTALIKAIRQGNVAMVATLVRAQADVNICTYKLGWTPLTCAAEHGHAEIGTLLCTQGQPDVNSQDFADFTALMIAAQNGHEKMVDVLLEQRASIDRCNVRGNTALLIAAAYGQAPIVRILLENRADIHARNKGGGTVLMVAALKGYDEIVRIVLNYGMLHDINLDMVDSSMNTALIQAACFEHAESVALLLYRNAQIDVMGANNDTALMHAVRGNHSGIISMLVLAGARYDVVNTAGQTAWSVASEDMKNVMAYAEREREFSSLRYSMIAHDPLSGVGELWARMPKDVRALVAEYAVERLSPEDRAREVREASALSEIEVKEASVHKRRQ